MRLPWRRGGRSGRGSVTLQAHFDRVIPMLAAECGLDLVATTLGWQAGGAPGDDLPALLERHARLFRERYSHLGEKRIIFPEQVTLYGPGRKGFWFCSLQFPQGLPDDRQPLRPFLSRLAQTIQAQGFLQAKVADWWQLGHSSPLPTVRLVAWDGQQRQGWQLPLEAPQLPAWVPYQGHPPYGGIAGYPELEAPKWPQPPAVSEQGRLQLLQPISDWLGTQVGSGLRAGKVGSLPAEGFSAALHEQTLALQQWLEEELAMGRPAPSAELALLRPGREGSVDFARFSLTTTAVSQEAECWALLRWVAEAWRMQGFVYALSAVLVVPGPRAGRQMLVALLHQWEGVMMQEAWTQLSREGVRPWQARTSEQGATPVLDGLCGYRLSDLQRQTLEQLQRGQLTGVAVGQATVTGSWCLEHAGHSIAYRCQQCGQAGCSRCMTMVASGRIVCHQCAQAS